MIHTAYESAASRVSDRFQVGYYCRRGVIPVEASLTRVVPSILIPSQPTRTNSQNIGQRGPGVS